MTVLIVTVLQRDAGYSLKPRFWFCQRHGRKSKAILNHTVECRILHCKCEAESPVDSVNIISSLDSVHRRYLWTVQWIVLTDASHETQQIGQRLFCT